MKEEQYIQTAICNYIRANYPEVIFTSDLSGIRLPMHLAKMVKPLKSSRGMPDLLILQPSSKYNYSALFIELKAPGAKITKKDGQLKSDPHLNEQRAIIDRLNQLGYSAHFAVGFEQARSIIDDYLK